MSRQSYLEVERLAKVYPGVDGHEGLTVFSNIHFAIEKGEFVCIIGHSGCGKSTILNILAALEEQSEGHVFIAGREVKGPGLDRGVVFQGHALMPLAQRTRQRRFRRAFTLAGVEEERGRSPLPQVHRNGWAEGRGK